MQAKNAREFKKWRAGDRAGLAIDASALLALCEKNLINQGSQDDSEQTDRFNLSLLPAHTNKCIHMHMYMY